MLLHMEYILIVILTLFISEVISKKISVKKYSTSVAFLFFFFNIVKDFFLNEITIRNLFGLTILSIILWIFSFSLISIILKYEKK